MASLLGRAWPFSQRFTVETVIPSSRAISSCVIPRSFRTRRTACTCAATFPLVAEERGEAGPVAGAMLRVAGRVTPFTGSSFVGGVGIVGRSRRRLGGLDIVADQPLAQVPEQRMGAIPHHGHREGFGRRAELLECELHVHKPFLLIEQDRHEALVELPEPLDLGRVRREDAVDPCRILRHSLRHHGVTLVPERQGSGGSRGKDQDAAAVGPAWEAEGRRGRARAGDSDIDGEGVGLMVKEGADVDGAGGWIGEGGGREEECGGKRRGGAQAFTAPTCSAKPSRMDWPTEITVKRGTIPGYSAGRTATLEVRRGGKIRRYEGVPVARETEHELTFDLSRAAGVITGELPVEISDELDFPRPR